MTKRQIYLSIILILFLVADGFIIYSIASHKSLSSIAKNIFHPSFGKDLVVGTWDDILDSQSLEFKPDGTVTMTIKDTPIVGTYTLDQKAASLSIMVNYQNIQFYWRDDRLLLSQQGFSVDVFSKRPDEAELKKIPCRLVFGNVLSDRGNGNYEMPPPTVASDDPNLTLMMLPGAQWTRKSQVGSTSFPECIGYTRSVDEIVKDIQLRGKGAPSPSDHNEAVFAVYEVRQ